MIRVEIVSTRGSTPRDAGAYCLVGLNSLQGTIGGGQVEFLAIEKAREMLAENAEYYEESYALNPFIGQCCGGEMVVRFTKVATAIEYEETKPHLTLFGLGSVGKALQKSLSLLPITLIAADDREGYGGVDVQSALQNAPLNSLFIITTHSHALDYSLAETILSEKLPLYCGMIGSQTKARRFHQYYQQKQKKMAHLKNFSCAFENFACPMGEKISDKRPEIIASLVTAEIVVKAFNRGNILHRDVAHTSNA